MSDDYKLDTLLNHPERVEMKEGNIPLIQPVYNSSKFTMSESIPFGEQFVYGRVSNPTTRQLEVTLSQIQKREDTIVVSSGIGALTGAFLGLLKSGDHIITFRELYKPARMFIRDHLPNFGITCSLAGLSQLDQLQSLIRPETKLIHFESPTNPNLQIADIEQILKIAKKNNILVSLDGTFAGLHQHTEFDIDVMIHSLTKFGNGHGDVIAGCISGRKEVIKKIRETTMYLGAHLDPQAAYLIQRGLKTYSLRYERQVQSAQKIAEYLSKHPGVAKVRYPGLPDSENHSLAKKQMRQMGAVVAFEIKPHVAASADKLCHKFKVIQLAASIGSTESLICPTQTFFGLDLEKSVRNSIGINEYSLRLSVGIEDVEDLINDLNQVLSLRES